MKEFWLCFVPLCVATDAVGTLPLLIGMTEDLSQAQVKRAIVQSVFVAMVVALLFLVGGRLVLQYLGITVADFMMAGGALLFIMSVMNVIGVEKSEHKLDPESLGAVPLGVPLIAGPAVLTTTLLLLGQYGPVPTALAVYVNIALAGVVFSLSGVIMRVLGGTGAKIVSKLSGLILAAIAVMMMRKGIVEIVLSLRPGA